MSKFTQMLRGLLLSLPIIAISGLAILGASAQVAPAGTPAGQISTQNMSDFESYPSGVNALAAPNVPPLIMLVMSRDEQLFNKAYPDYTALVAGGSVNTTYLDSFAYNGYFDPNICYTYDSTNKYYKAAASVSTGTHQCATGNSYWSGNFMNWVAMSRLDILRWTFYGGTRSTDTAAKTVLERAEIPDDLHAWAKVYSGSDINKYTPFSVTTTFCNVSTGTTGGWGAASQTSSGISSTPVIRTASGAWGDWASTAKAQCLNKQKTDDGGNSGRPPTTQISTDYRARVRVCQNISGTPDESFCVVDGTALKPEGLLQKYSKKDNNVKRFGLVTGSAIEARIGGQLRRNIGQLANNVTGTACAAGTGTGDGDEFSNVDGTFCYKSATSTPTEGIVMTLDRLQVTGWNGSDYGDSYGTAGDTTCHSASNPWGARGFTIQATPTMCPDFGNPLAGMYAQALRYIQGNTVANPETGGNLPNPTWVDPYGTASGASKPRNAPCASCSIVLVSSGLNTFDASNVPAVTNLTASTLTDTVQTMEGITGQYQLSTYYNTANLAGAPANYSLTTVGTNYSDIAICYPATIGNLSTVTGICNGAPGQQGSYLIAGLSYGAWTTPIRTDNKVSSNFKVKTYGVSLSDNLPSFSIPVNDTQSISISPSCRADPTGSSTYTTCYIGSVRVGAQQTYNTTTATGFNTYGLVPTTTYPNVGSYYFVWEDSQYGSDHDQDANVVISYCVGTSCNLPSSVTSGVAICDPVVTNGVKTTTASVIGGACNAATGQLTFTPGSNDIVVRNQLTGFSSNGMSLGYQVSGTATDGLVEFRVTNGGAATDASQNGAVFNCNLLGNIDCKSSPQVTHFTLGSSAAISVLQTPLWYAAKYSGFSGTSPSLPAGQDPPNYFFARNAGALKDQLDTVFQQITSSAANNFGNATTPSSSNDIKGNGLSYQVQYFQQRLGVNWTGSLQAFWSDNNGYQREGTVVSGNQVLDSGAEYVVSGPDTSAGALAGTSASYRCTVPPIPPAGSTSFNPSTNSACSIVSATNLLKPAWDAGTLLNAYYDPTAAAGTADANAITNLTTQRTYAADASAAANIGQRYMFTYLTASANGSTATGTVTNGTQTDFVWNADWKDPASCPTTSVTLSATSGFWGCYDAINKVRTGNYSLLNEKDPALAQKLVNWVRGVEDPTDYRSRTNNLSTGKSTYRLGDIVDSSPTIVGTPAESYDLLYSDFSYASFRSNYRNRRQMVYVGANDGMLHAFNGGFYVTGQASDGTTTATNPTAYRQLPSTLKSGSPLTTATQGNNWALGQEAWAFIPENLLPHLRWLADKNYTHVFYVDGSPVVTDAQIFTSTTITGNSSTCQAGSPATTDIDAKGHVCGWGTVMVVPFRLGGGPIAVDTVGSSAAADTQTSNSAYVVLDVTDPEQAPTVLGELTTGTFTTSSPAFAVHREQSDGKLHFLLTIGSGPADNGGPSGNKTVSATAGSTLGVWVYDLANIVAQSSTPVKTLSTGPANSFAGDMVASDFNLNYSSESVYFGVVTNPVAPTGTPPVIQPSTGGLWKLDMNSGPATNADGSANPPDTSDPSTWTLKQVINNGQPVTIRPTVALDSAYRPMVYFGTGRSFTTNDDSGKSLQGTQQQYIYGVTDNSMLTGLAAACQTMPATSTLFTASATTVGSKGAVSGLPSSGFTGIATLSNLQNVLLATDGSTGCYSYSGWQLALAAGDITGNADGTDVQLPSERVVSSQTLLGGILLTPTYLPPSKAAIDASGSSDCNPVPVPGTSNLYGLNYLTGTADPSLATAFGVVSGNVSKSVKLGNGKASAPVLHSANGKITAAFGLGGGTTLQSIGTLNQASSGEISWREPVENQ
jgi:Tfp pilus assembly protein, tip-associated adhesin PilY1